LASLSLHRACLPWLLLLQPLAPSTPPWLRLTSWPYPTTTHSLQMPAGRRSMRVFAAGQKLEYIWTDGQEGKEIKVRDGGVTGDDRRRRTAVLPQL